MLAEIIKGIERPNNKYLIFDDKNYLIWIYWYEGIK